MTSALFGSPNLWAQQFIAPLAAAHPPPSEREWTVGVATARAARERVVKICVNFIVNECFCSSGKL